MFVLLISISYGFSRTNLFQLSSKPYDYQNKVCNDYLSLVLQVHWDVCVQCVYHVRYWCAHIISHEGAARRLLFHCICLYHYLHFYHSVPCLHTKGICPIFSSLLELQSTVCMQHCLCVLFSSPHLREFNLLLYNPFFSFPVSYGLH